MAVELRCPDCRAKLRLKAAPEAGTEVECPKCGTVFPAPEPEPEPDEDTPKKKAEDGEEKAKKDGEKKSKKGKKEAVPNAPRKRKAKKRETSKAALIGVISVGAIMLICMTGVLIWFFTRVPKSVEMFYYVPEDAQIAMGMNLGHAQKYPEFYKSLKTLIDGAEFKPAGDAIGKAAGSDMDSLMDYVVVARSFKNGHAIVFRTKAEFDSGTLAKIPGADKKSLDGKTYYVAPGLLPNNEAGRVFAPTNRLVVVCPASAARLNDNTFKKMLNGNGENKEKTLGVRMGDLGKRVTRGTFWQLWVFDNEVKTDTALPPQEKAGAGGGGGDDSKVKERAVFSDATNGSIGFGIKASLGSREVRFEIVVSCKDSEKASNFAKKMKESDLGKGDEGTPPKWFKDRTSNLGGQKVAAQLLSNIGFGSSGDLFYARSSVDTVDLQQGAATAIGLVTGQNPQNQGSSPGGGPGMGGPGMGPGGGPGAPPGPGGVPGGPPMPGGVPPGPMMPKMRRRSHRALCR